VSSRTDAGEPPDPRLRPVDATSGAGFGPVWGIASDDLNVTLLSWPPRETLAEHVNDELDVLIVVIAGRGTAIIDGVSEALEPSMTRLIARGAARSIVAGPEGLRYLSIHRRRRLQITGLGAPSAPPSDASDGR
jgi:uncharacterized cupin superfamily protein